MADDAQQDASTDATETTDAAPATGEDALGDAGKQALDRMKVERNEAAKRAKQLERELEQVRTANLSEAEKAISEAEKRGENNALGRVGQRLVDAELRLATAGRVLTTEALLTFDRSKFLTDDFDVDREALTKWVEQHSQATSPTPTRFGEVDQGVRKTTPPANKDEREVARSLFGST
jgi:hypothetical protein